MFPVRADQCGPFDAELGRDLIGGAETDVVSRAMRQVFSEMRWTASALQVV